MSNQKNENPKIERLLRVKEVLARTGLPYSTLYFLIKLDRFPAPLKLHGRCVAWPEPDVQAWIDERVNNAKGVI